MELLIVLALIGIFAAIVIASLNTSRTKAADAATKDALSSTRSQAELLYSVSGSYANVCTQNHVVNGVRSIYPQVQSAATVQGGLPVDTTAAEGSSEKVTCHAAAGGWAAAAPLKKGGFFCVDWKGAAMETATPLGNAATTCS